MTILYKVNNANNQSFNSTLSERMALIESLSLVFTEKFRMIYAPYDTEYIV